MHRLREWCHRWWGTLRPGRSDGDLQQELRQHLELAAEAARRRGVSADESRRAARLEWGGNMQAMDALRDQRGVPWIADLARDVRHGARTLSRSPGFTVVAVATLALGIGANTAIFSMLHGVILRPLIYPQPERLLRLTATFPLTGATGVGLSHPEYAEFRQMNRSFAHVGAFTTGRANTGGGSGSWTGEVNVSVGDRAMRVRSAAVDEHLLSALGVQPAHGRFFAAGETDAMADRPGLGGYPLAILSHELWQTAFAGQSVVGRTVSVDGRSHEIIGIMPPEVDLMDTRPEIWLPLGIHPVTRRIRTSHLLSIVGRLNDGVTVQAANAELTAFLENWGERAGVKGHVPARHASRPDDHVLELQPLHEAIVGDASRALWVLQAAVGLVLLIASANLANLAMARAETRRREFAVRTSLGASRARLLRQAMTEGVLLAIAGGALGAWLARMGVGALVAAYPTSLPRTSDIAVDVPVLIFALVASIATGLLFGLAPIAQMRFRDFAAALTEGGERTGKRAANLIRRGLVTAEVAFAVMLVVSAGLLIRTVYNLTRVDAGFDRARLITFSMTLPRATSNDGGRAAVYQRLLETLRATPGVQAATAMSDLPLNRFAQRFATRIENASAATGQTTETVDYYQFVMSGYFDTMRIPVVVGRSFAPADTTSLERVAIVNETLADKLWRGRDPIGQRVRPNLSASMGTEGNPWHTVIGVARDVKEGGVAHAAGSELYLFLDQPAPPVDSVDGSWRAQAPPTLNVVLRTDLPPAALSATIRAAVRNLDPTVPVVRLREMDAVFTESIRRPRLLALLLAAFGGLALLLAAIGTYGVLSYMVTERRREIGIRMALGAARSSVVALVMRQGLQAAGVGVALGIAGAVAVSRLIAALLFEVRPTDPVTLIAVALTIGSVAVLACWFPAWRASRLDPSVVLREN